VLAIPFVVHVDGVYLMACAAHQMLENVNHQYVLPTHPLHATQLAMRQIVKFVQMVLVVIDVTRKNVTLATEVVIVSINVVHVKIVLMEIV
jgi:hypothetical protein